MHILDGTLTAPVIGAGYVIAAAGTAVGLRRLDTDEIPKAALLTSAFFVASLIRLPVGVASVHLLLTGILGLTLGWVAFPAILIGLTLQLLMFQYGGWTTLGVNTVNMALPAVVCHYLFRRIVAKANSRAVLAFCGACVGSLPVLFSSILLAMTMIAADINYTANAVASILAHLPVVGVEGLATMSLLLFLKQTCPHALLPSRQTQQALPHLQQQPECP